MVTGQSPIDQSGRTLTGNPVPDSPTHAADRRIVADTYAIPNAPSTADGGRSTVHQSHSVCWAALKAAFPLTIPICLGFLFLGASYGILMGTKGFSFIWPMCMSAFIFAGSMEFVTVNLLLSAFNPVAAFLLALMVNARHLFYGLSMLKSFKGLGWKRPYLIFGMCDETFAINSTAKIPQDIDRGWFYWWVTACNQSYWVVGATVGGLIGSHLPFNTDGLEFVLTALFLVIFLDQWLSNAHREHLAAMIGVLSSLACLVIFGADDFMIPSMAVMLVAFIVLRPHLDILKPNTESAANDDAVSSSDNNEIKNEKETKA
ncbi:AzlC family ABC transporter permease [Bifidobacterium scaligerum]|uniref:AzlC family ABC transporter permease n=1 Tax=Bifidobacterium scaligerum TaxID=2052656 RepID=UPI001FAF4ECF|nr:AzlC family ABC transporter permease [Bifidobacterium scaligerum]